MVTVEQNPYTERLDNVMSNFDHEIDRDVAQQLKEREAWAAYPGWNFNARVWWDRDAGTYRADVWRYHVVVDSCEGSLEDIMTNVSAAYGDD